jgi:hypothetical protein
MKLQSTPPIPVLFRTDKRDKTITAWFPTIPSEPNYYLYCQTYEHVGQHGSGSMDYMTRETRAATQEEYAPLLRELTEQVGYTLRVVKRITHKMTLERIQTGRELNK